MSHPVRAEPVEALVPRVHFDKLSANGNELTRTTVRAEPVEAPVPRVHFHRLSANGSDLQIRNRSPRCIFRDGDINP